MYTYSALMTDEGIYISDFIVFGFFMFVTYVTHKGVLNAMGNDYGYSYYQDIFIINMFTQLLAAFSRKGLYVYLLVPAYLLYISSGFIWSYISSPSQPEEEQLTDAQRRKREKKEKPKVKYIK